MNRCDICGKFKSWDDLVPVFTPDHAIGDFDYAEESHVECSDCREKDLVGQSVAGAKQG